MTLLNIRNSLHFFAFFRTTVVFESEMSLSSPWGSEGTAPGLNRLENQRSQRRQRQRQRLGPFVIGHGRRFKFAEISLAAAPVDFGVAVEELAPRSAEGEADAVIVRGAGV